ncbi:MAG: hypothetical protein KDK10_09870 [Maritimibacter sp.]|nr:hypothetical protein [Maritimibacter sp.]
MIRPAARLAVLATLAAAPAGAAELFSAEGAWLGEGQLATGARAPLERGRCRVEITPGATGAEVDVIGTCAVAAGMSDISLKLVRDGAGAVQAGVWSAATGQTVQYAGTETAGAIALASTTPLVVDGVAYDTRVDVSAPEGGTFDFRQLLRAEGEEAWRLVAEMSYRPAGG